MTEKLLRTKYNDYDLNGIPNPYFQDLRISTNVEQVSEEIRLKLLEKWEDHKQPLGGGKKSDVQIVKDFISLTKLDINQILGTDFEGKRNVLKYFGKAPSGINQYFPEMLNTQISLGNKSASVMDVIKTKEAFYKFFESVVYRDRMYSFTQWFDDTTISQEVWDLVGTTIPILLMADKNISGHKLPFYFKKDDNNYYRLDKLNVKYVGCSEKEYENNMKIFPQITQSFRLGGGSQPVSNFSAGIARFLIKHGFKKAMDNNLIENDTFIVLDPSTGWAGRLVGLLSCYTEIRELYKEKTSNELTVIYLTTDPNVEIKDRYMDIVKDWFSVIEPMTDKKHFGMFKDLSGSETPEFLLYCKDKLKKLKVNGCNIGLTSPPYFNRERYSDDVNQSWMKYGSSYESWSKGFLKPTISNISELMINGGIFFMNIADLKNGGKLLPLEQDTIDGGNEYGIPNIGVLKMLMATMTGNNKNKDTGGQPKNVVNLGTSEKEDFRKFEPIFMLKKK